MNIESLTGKRISYHDGFSGSTTAFTITSVAFEGDSYKVMGDGCRDFLSFGMQEMKQLVETGRTQRKQFIDSCPFKDTYKIQG